MAWNEPGGSGGKDPWGGRGSEQGPPDLDEMMRRFQDRLAGLFGRRRGPGGGSNAGSTAVFVVGIILLVWALSGIYVVNEGSRGVVLQFGAYKETSLAGPHWYPRFIQSVQVINTEKISSLELGMRQGEGLMLTQDENLVDIKFGIQYKISNPRDYLFNVVDPEATLRDVTESAIREVVGKSQMDFVLTGGRSDIVARAQQIAQETLDRYKSGLVITSLNMQDAQAPEQVQGAFADAIKAREDEQRLKNEAEAYANQVIPKARGEAARITEDANAYKAKVIAEAEGETARFLKVLDEYQKAPSVTRERMYIDALETVLSRSSKVMVDTRNNNMLYLPLDKITQQEQATTTAPVAVQAPAPEAAAPAPDLRSRDAARRREVR
jgi:membrane protease subunit HflK